MINSARDLIDFNSFKKLTEITRIKTFFINRKNAYQFFIDFDHRLLSDKADTSKSQRKIGMSFLKCFFRILRYIYDALLFAILGVPFYLLNLRSSFSTNYGHSLLISVQIVILSFLIFLLNRKLPGRKFFVFWITIIILLSQITIYIFCPNSEVMKYLLYLLILPSCFIFISQILAKYILWSIVKHDERIFNIALGTVLDFRANSKI